MATKSAISSRKTPQEVVALFIDGRTDGGPCNPRPLSQKQARWLHDLCVGGPLGVSDYDMIGADYRSGLIAMYSIFLADGRRFNFRQFRSGRGELEQSSE